MQRKITMVLLISMIVVVAGIALFLIMSDEKASPPPEIIPIEQDVDRQRIIAVGADFDDGLRNPYASQKYNLDEFGEGIASREVFVADINADGVRDRITKTRVENGTAHFQFDYTIELGSDNGKFINITLPGFRTTEGADCSLTKLKFIFAPSFSVIKISRNWEDSWTTPTIATRTVYILNGDKLQQASSERLGSVCDVATFF